MIRFSRGLAAVAALGALAPAIRAYVLIDDFQAGDYHSVINWPNNQDHHVLEGLDKSHSAFGRRGADVTVNTNFDRVPVFIDYGGGQARISYDSPSGDIATATRTLFGGAPGIHLDLSAETELLIDLFTEDPPNRLADQWSLNLVDEAGHSAFNGSFLNRLGGIRFKRSGFTGNVDWSRIRLVEFRQDFSPDSGDVPMAYTVTKIYTVPEPGTAAIAAAFLLGSLRASWRRRPGTV